MTTRRNIVAPNLTVAPKQYEQRYQEQLNNVQRLFYASVTNRVNLALPYGNFYTSLKVANYPTDPAGGNITNPTANTVNLVPFLNTSAAFNVTIGQQNTHIYVAETGVYNVQFSAQCDLLAGSNKSIFFWLRQNGTDVPASTGEVELSGSAPSIVSWNWVMVLQEGDYIQLAWGSPDTHAALVVGAATTTGLIKPAIPAVILTVCWVSPIPSSVGIS